MTTRKRPAPPQNRPSPDTTNDNDAKSTVLHRLFGHAPHEPLTREDREDLDVIVAAVERGFRIAVRCRVCGHWLSNPRSVKSFVGPRCAAKAVTK
ncbi:DUF6011 domain-containing protein [Mycolicibacterium vanbaalenii]|uniref:DUF6011 domain-containing protein n=1 Tax=Mycolicibacterium vanbaalenii TaxID=110539 RepID=UPI0038994EE8